MREPKGFSESADVAKEGAKTAKAARDQLEQSTGKSVVSPMNAKSLAGSTLEASIEENADGGTPFGFANPSGFNSDTLAAMDDAVDKRNLIGPFDSADEMLEDTLENMNLEIDESELTIMGIRFDNKKDFRSVWHALSTNMFEGWEPSQRDVLNLKEKVKALREESNTAK